MLMKTAKSQVFSKINIMQKEVADLQSLLLLFQNHCVKIKSEKQKSEVFALAKILDSWSGMRKYLEEEMLTDSLKGRVRYNCTTYVGMDGWCVFEIFVDKKLVKRFSYETVCSYFIEMGYKKESKKTQIMGYWDGFWDVFRSKPMKNRTEYTDDEFCNALEEYRNSDIQKSIHSENPIVKMFALLDRRIGKRTLENITDEIKLQPEWVRYFYSLRTEN